MQQIRLFCMKALFPLFPSVKNQCFTEENEGNEEEVVLTIVLYTINQAVLYGIFVSFVSFCKVGRVNGVWPQFDDYFTTSKAPGTSFRCKYG
jgi:hypothetical protein